MQFQSTLLLALVLSALLLLLAEPSLANKFETIGSGVSGTAKLKVDYLRIVFYVTSAIMLLAGILSIALRKDNALYLNYTMWKTSSIIFFFLSLATLAIGLSI